jgi:hypothetical protein
VQSLAGDVRWLASYMYRRTWWSSYSTRDAMAGKRGTHERPSFLIGDDDDDGAPIVIDLGSDGADVGFDGDERLVAGPAAAAGQAAGPARSAVAVRRTTGGHLSADNWEVVMSFLGWREVVNLSTICRLIRDAALGHVFHPSDTIHFGRIYHDHQGVLRAVMPPRRWPLRGANIIIAFELDRPDRMRPGSDWHRAPCIEHATELQLTSFANTDNFDFQAPYMRSLQRIVAEHAHTFDWPAIARFEDERWSGWRLNDRDEHIIEREYPTHLRIVHAYDTVSASVVGPDGNHRLADGLSGSRLLANLEELYVRFDDVSTRILVANCPRLRILRVKHSGDNPFLRSALYAAVCPALEYARVSMRVNLDPFQVDAANAEITVDSVTGVYMARPQYLIAHPEWPRELALRRIVVWSDKIGDPQAPLAMHVLQEASRLEQFVMLDQGGPGRHARPEQIDILALRPHLTHMRIVLDGSVAELARDPNQAWPSLTHLHVTASPVDYPNDWSLLGMTKLQHLTLEIKGDEAAHWPFNADIGQLFARLPPTLKELVLLGVAHRHWDEATEAALRTRFPLIEFVENATHVLYASYPTTSARHASYHTRGFNWKTLED